MKRYYYSNGQIFKEQFDKKKVVTSMTESFPVNYGKWCYLYGFKVYRRTDVLYNCDGTPWQICFLGGYNHKRVSIQIDYLNYNHQKNVCKSVLSTYYIKNLHVCQQPIVLIKLPNTHVNLVKINK